MHVASEEKNNKGWEYYGCWAICASKKTLDLHGRGILYHKHSFDDSSFHTFFLAPKGVCRVCGEKAPSVLRLRAGLAKL